MKEKLQLQTYLIHSNTTLVNVKLNSHSFHLLHITNSNTTLVNVKLAITTNYMCNEFLFKYNTC